MRVTPRTAMKDQLVKLISDGLKWLVGFITASLVGYGLLTVDDAKQIHTEAVAVIAGAAGILTLLATMVIQAAWKKIFGGSGSGGNLMLLIGTVVAVGGLLPSCNTFADVTGGVYYRDPESGAKAGLTFTPGEAVKLHGKVPLLDPETGEQIGLADLTVPITKPKKVAATK